MHGFQLGNEHIPGFGSERMQHQDADLPEVRRTSAIHRTEPVRNSEILQNDHDDRHDVRHRIIASLFQKRMVVKVPWVGASVSFGDFASHVQIPVGGFPHVDFLQQCRPHSHDWSREGVRITFPRLLAADSHRVLYLVL